jgi:hypothetical protein
MNKKLFSWKALAGLALLVAMGLTSCKQGTEVDPTDPYKPKPTQPGVITGSGDLNLNLGKASDLATLWNSSVSADTKKAIKDKKEITVIVKTSGVKLAADGGSANTMTLPDFFQGSGTADKIVHLIMDGGFAEAKAALTLDATALANSVVDIVLPGGGFNLDLKANTCAPTLRASNATAIGILNATVSTDQKKLIIGNGVTVQGYYPISGQVGCNGGTIEALIATYDVQAKAKDKGVEIPGGVLVKQIIAAANIIVDACGYQAPLEKVTVRKGYTVTLKNTSGDAAWAGNNGQPYVNAIVGEDASASVVNIPSQAGLKNVTSVSKVALQNGMTDILDITNGSIFTETTFNAKANIKNGVSSISNIKFTRSVTINNETKDITYQFNGVTFDAAQFLNVNTAGLEPVKDASGNPAYDVTYYYKDIATGVWKQVADETQIPASVKTLDASGVTVAYDAAKLNVSTAGVLTDTDNKVGSHYWFRMETALMQPITNSTVVVSLQNCKYGSSNINNTNAKNLFNTATATSTSLPGYKVKINDILFKWVWANNSCALVSVAE